MEKWAKAWPACHFLCLCTAGDDEHELSGQGGHASSQALASKMAELSGLKTCVNGIVQKPLFLTAPFEQLGCSGFIVLDAEHNVVCAKTASYLNLKKWAFTHVDTLLDVATRGVPVPRVCPGEMVTLEGTNWDGSRALCLTLGSRALPPRADQLEVAVQPKGSRVWVPAESCIKDSEREGHCKSCCGCDKSTDKADDTATEKADDIALKPMQPLASVQMPSLDAEHEECVSAVNSLVASGSVEDLRAVHASFSKHFQHEEDMMLQAGFGGGDPRFCARTSHAKDHERIIAHIDQRINEAASGVVPAKVIKQIMVDLEEHATKYDDMYVDTLSQHKFE